MSVSLQILRDDLIKIWSSIEMHQISMALGLMFCLIILKLSIQKIDRRDFITEIMYTIFVAFCFLTLLVVVPDTSRTRTSLASQLVVAMLGAAFGFFRWNTSQGKQIRKKDALSGAKGPTKSSGAANG